MNETAPLAPTRHKLHVHAVYRMAETGIVGERDRVELIGGNCSTWPRSGRIIAK